MHRADGGLFVYSFVLLGFYTLDSGEGALGADSDFACQTKESFKPLRHGKRSVFDRKQRDDGESTYIYNWDMRYKITICSWVQDGTWSDQSRPVLKHRTYSQYWAE